MENMQDGKNVCVCKHHKVTPVLVILFGVVFLLGNWGTLSWDTVNTIWPILVIIGGIMKWKEKSNTCKCC